VASRYEAHLGVMARETAAVRERLQREEAALATYQGVVELLRDPATRVVELRSPSTPNATARLVWNDKAGGHLLVANLPPAPEARPTSSGRSVARSRAPPASSRWTPTAAPCTRWSPPATPPRASPSRWSRRRACPRRRGRS